MSLRENTRYSHFSQENRFKIQFGLEQKKSYGQIAKEIGVHRSTVGREIMRNSVLVKNTSYKKNEPEFVRVYRAENAQISYCERREGNFKLDRIPGLMERINELSINKYHPVVIENEIGRVVCFKTIYNYIERKLVAPGRVKQRKRRKKRYTGRKRVLGDCISLRPPEVESRKTFGHMEGDLVLGKRDSKEVWLTLVERKTRHGFVLRLPNQFAITVKTAIEVFLESHPWVKSITFDNGSEFAKCHELPIPVYFARPYHSWERGTNENFNRLVRRELPKGRNLANYSDADFTSSIHFINNLPRKLLDFKSAHQAFLLELHLAA